MVSTNLNNPDYIVHEGDREFQLSDYLAHVVADKNHIRNILINSALLWDNDSDSLDMLDNGFVITFEDIDPDDDIDASAELLESDFLKAGYVIAYEHERKGMHIGDANFLRYDYVMTVKAIAHYADVMDTGRDILPEAVLRTLWEAVYDTCTLADDDLIAYYSELFADDNTPTPDDPIVEVVSSETTITHINDQYPDIVERKHITLAHEAMQSGDPMPNALTSWREMATKIQNTYSEQKSHYLDGFIINVLTTHERDAYLLGGLFDNVYNLSLWFESGHCVFNPLLIGALRRVFGNQHVLIDMMDAIERYRSPSAYIGLADNSYYLNSDAKTVLHEKILPDIKDRIIREGYAIAVGFYFQLHPQTYSDGSIVKLTQRFTYADDLYGYTPDGTQGDTVMIASGTHGIVNAVKRGKHGDYADVFWNKTVLHGARPIEIPIGFNGLVLSQYHLVHAIDIKHGAIKRQSWSECVARAKNTIGLTDDPEAIAVFLIDVFGRNQTPVPDEINNNVCKVSYTSMGRLKYEYYDGLDGLPMTPTEVYKPAEIRRVLSYLNTSRDWYYHREGECWLRLSLQTIEAYTREN
jgi:hypothetical protein